MRSSQTSSFRIKHERKIIGERRVKPFVFDCLLIFLDFAFIYLDTPQTVY